MLIDNRLNNTLRFRVTKLCLGLSLKLRFSNLDGDHSGQSFFKIVAGKREFQVFQQVIFLCVSIECSCQCLAKSGDMGAAFMRINVVDIAENIFLIGVVVL